MARKPKSSKPSFFKVLMEGYATRLNLPSEFVKKIGKILPASVKLRISSGETWNVKVEENEDDKYCFTRGWSRFVKDLELEIANFLVFWFNIRNSTFDVLVCDTNACEREISAKNPPADQAYSDELTNALGMKEVRPQMEIVLRRSHRSRVFIRKGFLEGAGLIGKKSVLLEYPPEQRRWHVVLDTYRLEMAVGWFQFRKENRLVYGETYLFEFNPTTNVIQVKNS